MKENYLKVQDNQKREASITATFKVECGFGKTYNQCANEREGRKSIEWK